MTPTRMAPAIEAIAKGIAAGERLLLPCVPWPMHMRILVLAPHPDDFDAMAVTLRFFRDRGDDIRLAVLSSSAGGVQDNFCQPPTAAVKGAIREREQRESCRLFGLPEDRIAFLRLPEDEGGDPRNDDENYSVVEAVLKDFRPDLVLLPHGNDPNPGHRLAADMLRRFARRSHFPFSVLLNRDPKTLQMRPDLYTFFEEEDALWKGRLLRCHQSQHQRNLNIRGYGFDERILRVNRDAAAGASGSSPYAEVFEFWTAAITAQRDPKT